MTTHALSVGDRRIWVHGPALPVRVVEIESRDCVIVEDETGSRFYAHPIELRMKEGVDG